MKRAPLKGRRILTTMKQKGAAALYFVSRKQADQIVIEDQPRHFLRHADFVESLRLHLKNGRVPPAREERRVGSEQQSLRPGDIQRAPEHGAQIQMGLFVSHPAIAARSIQVYVRA